jgi:hypothetical protein
MKPRRNEEAQAHIGLSSHTKKKSVNISASTYHCVDYPNQKYLPIPLAQAKDYLNFQETRNVY